MMTRGTTGRVVLSGVVLAYAGGYVLHRIHAGLHETHDVNPWLHWLRDSTFALPPALLVVLAATVLARLTVSRLGVADSIAWARLTWVLAVAAGYAAFSVPGNLVHGSTFGAGHEDMGVVEHLTADAFASLGAALAIFALAVLVLGTPWERVPPHARFLHTLRLHGVRGTLARGTDSILDRRWRLGPTLLGIVTLAAAVAVVPHVGSAGASPAAVEAGCAGFEGTRTIKADVVALEQKWFYNRLGVQAGALDADKSAVDAYGLMYALRRDVVRTGTETIIPNTGTTFGDGTPIAGNVELRPGKRPRPLVLRMNVGDCLEVRFQNLLSPAGEQKPDHPADRHVGIHVNGMQMGGQKLGGIDNDSSFVGKNDSSLLAPGAAPRTYTLFAEYENTYLMYSLGTPVGGEGGNASIALGLFGAVNVEPYGTQWYRSQVTRADMELAGTDSSGAAARTTDGHPLIDYEKEYPDGTPILNMLDGDGEIVHSDLNAIITGPNLGKIPTRSYPSAYWENENYNQYRKHGEEPFREFTVIFHDEIKAVQAFPEFFDDPVLSHTLHGVRDGFAINYGTGGIGAEIIANRLGVGPMGKCVECKYEEFFLSSWAVGDPAMVLDQPTYDQETKAATLNPDAVVPYPDDPANVHHSYLNDRVKFRNLHAGPKEHHIFHLHAHQWQYDWNEKTSSYLDSQNIGPGGGFTYEIAHGGSGNRNKTAGDSIFHCHFYPHFAQGMWELWRVHDTFELGTELDGTGHPVAGSRAFPDGEITKGTPIPGVVPLPGLAMAPMPNAATTVVPYDLDGVGGPDSSQIDADGNGIADLAEAGGAFATSLTESSANPGYPFFVPGVAGHRAPTPPMDLAKDGSGNAIDGGLERHIIVAGEREHFETRLDLNTELTKASVVYLPEGGTPAELTAMKFHSQAGHPAPDGKTFETNGLPAVPGAPFADPCRTDTTASGGVRSDPQPVPGAADLRTYKAAVIELDATLNKLGWHFPQQRILALNNDVEDYLRAPSGTTKPKAPEPLVMRLNVGDCTTFEHTNLVPNVYELDDYQVRTPTDIIGQHIHLVKFDVLSADGSANGFNYEDGTLSPEEVEERIHAIRAEKAEKGAACSNDTNGNARLDAGETQSRECPLAEKHPDPAFESVGDLAWGARTTVQRWYADPVLNKSWDQGVGTVFTHDHYGPSTHQQVGLYATVLVEPRGSTWRDSETGKCLGGISSSSLCDPVPRDDGGPTSWRADIVFEKEPANSFREFYLEYSDFQHAYEKGGGTLGSQDNEADPPNNVTIPSYADFGSVVNPSVRLEAPSPRKEDLIFFPPNCPGGPLRPCPEAISADDPGTYVVNYRNEPQAARVFDPKTKGQATGDRGDLSRVYESRTDRADSRMNSQPATYAPRAGVGAGDPFTPLLRAYQGDKIRLRVQVGGQEEEHNFTLHGLRWLHEPLNVTSGWRGGTPSGISEYFNLEAPIVPDLSTGQSNKNVDYVWEAGAQTEDRWNGIWGLLRTYGKGRGDLQKLPSNKIPDNGWTVSNLNEFSQTCPKKTDGEQTPTRRYAVTALRVAQIEGFEKDGLVYNDDAAGPRTTLVDPNALVYLPSDDLELVSPGKYRLRDPDQAIEPLVLRAAAGDCIKVDLTNALLQVEDKRTVEDHDGFNLLPPILRKNTLDGGGFVTFNANDIRPSNRVGLVPQLVAHDVLKSGGLEVGSNTSSNLVAPGDSKQYTWFAGEIDFSTENGKITMKARPVEYGATNLMPSDPIKGVAKGLVGSLVVEPPGATWEEDPDTRLSATVSFPDGNTTRRFREFVTVLQDDLNLRKGGCSTGWAECAVPGPSGEGPDDPQDSGNKAINYGAEPLWHRLGIDSRTSWEDLLGNTGKPVLDEAAKNAHRVFSNGLVGGRDPQTAVFAASPEAPPDSIRMRLVQPGGHARGHEFTVHGHPWQRQPYIDASNRLNRDFHENPTNLGGDMDGHNMTSWWIGSQEGMGASLHYDLLMKASGGKFNTPGDYLFRDFGAFGTYQGLWGIIRVDLTPPMAAGDLYVADPGTALQIGPVNGVKANDLDLDGNPLPAAVVTAGPKNGTLSLAADGSFSYTPKAGFAGKDGFTYRLGSGGDTANVTLLVRSSTPKTANDYAAVATGSSEVVIPVLANDSDPDGDKLKLVLTDDDLVKVSRIQGTSAKGMVFPFGADGVRYAPFPGASGTDAFKYTVVDATGNKTDGTVFVTITGGEGSVTVSSVNWSMKEKRWIITGSGGTIENPKALSATALLEGSKTIGKTTVTATSDGVPWKIGPTGTSAPRNCGQSVTVKSSLGPSIAGVPITCR
jgi:hypothetical protein